MKRNELIRQAEQNIAEASVNATIMIKNLSTPEDFKPYALNMIEFGTLVKSGTFNRYLIKEDIETLEEKVESTYKQRDFSKSLRNLVEGKLADINEVLLADLTLTAQKQLSTVKEFEIH